MRSYSGKRFPWLLARSAQFDPYASTPVIYTVPRRDRLVEARTLTQKLEGLVQHAFAQADSEAGKQLAAVLLNVRRRVAPPGRSGVTALPANDP